MTVTTRNTYIGNGVTTDFTFTFSYLDKSHVQVTIDNVATTAFTFFAAATLRFTVAPANGSSIVIYRSTPTDALLADFTAGSAIREQDLELDLQQVLNVAQELTTFVEQQSPAGLQEQVTTASANAAAAVTAANAAQTTATTAYTTANSIAATATAANTTATSALTTATAANTTANGIAATASSALSTANSATTTANTALATANSVNASVQVPASNRNRLINGSMAVNQRSESTSTSIATGAALTYTLDRWYAYCTGSSSFAGVTRELQADGSHRLSVTGAGGTTLTGVGVGQRIESLNSFDLAGTTATLSASILNQQLTPVTWAVYYATTTDSFGTLAAPTRTLIATGTFSATATFTRFTAQVAIPAAATTGLEVLFTTGSLSQTNKISIGNVQLEAGTAATAFERRNIAQETSLCLRYFEWCSFNIRAYASISGQISGCSINFALPKRVVPALSSVTSDQTAAANLTSNANSPSVSYESKTGCLASIASVAGGYNTYIGYRFSASAEL
jgi:hypothetical protein